MPALKKVSVVLLVLVLTLLSSRASVLAATHWTVTSTLDDGSAGTLRYAAANASPGDTIKFNLTYPATIVLGSTLGIDTNLTITGPGAANLALSGNNAFQVFAIAAGSTVSISGLTIENGSSSTSFIAGGGGGGIVNSGTLTLTNCTISNNSAVTTGGFLGGVGGGILNNPNGVLSLTDSTVSGNTANANGGGILNNGTLTITGSTVSGNSSYYDGGGLFNGSGGAVTLSDSTVSRNIATANSHIDFYGGGGIFNGGGGTITLTNDTVSGNGRADWGGGIFNYGTMTVNASAVFENHSGIGGGGILNFGTLTMTNSTVSSNGSGDAFGDGILNLFATLTLNFTTLSANGQFDQGGNILSESGTLTLKNTIVALDVPNCYLLSDSSDTDDGYNLSDDNSCSLLTSPTDQTNEPAGLVSLDAQDDPQDNGGPTPTVALAGSSTAIDAIPVADCTDADGNRITTDQRGVLRPQGPGCDIGAFEYATPNSVIETLNGYVDSLGLPKGEQQSLSSSLGAALASLNSVQSASAINQLTLSAASQSVQSGRTPAINQLNAFLNKVSADQKTGKLTSQEATVLIQQVQLILQMLGA